MSDILIRGVPTSVVEEADRRAQQLGVSRNEYLRRFFEEEFAPTQRKIQLSDFERVAELARDLADPQVMKDAWS